MSAKSVIFVLYLNAAIFAFSMIGILVFLYKVYSFIKKLYNEGFFYEEERDDTDRNNKSSEN